MRAVLCGAVRRHGRGTRSLVFGVRADQAVGQVGFLRSRKRKTRGKSSTGHGFGPPGHFLVRLAGLVWTPKGLSGPKYAGSGLLGVRWGDLSRWQHLGRPGGPPAACRRRGHVRFPLVGAWGWFPQKRVPSMVLVPSCRAGSARFSGRKNSEGTFLVRLIWRSR